MGIAIGVRVGRDWPSAAGWLKYLGLLSALDNEELITQIGEGDHEALSQLFKRFARSIRDVGSRILRDDAEAEDLVQEVFLYIHRKASLFNSAKGAARSWIFQIASSP